MAAPTNTTVSGDLNAALDVEVLKNFDQSYDQLAEILGIFSPEIVSAGQALYAATITGALATDAYTEGDEVPISKYTVAKTALGEVTLDPHRKRTTAQAVLKAGYDIAVMRTDAKMLADVRNKVVTDFVTALGNGTGTATGTTLQATLANADAALGDAMETNGDGAPESVIHIMNRQDAAAYLGTQQITTQTVFGLTYLENFLGVERVLLTNKVASKTLYAVPTDNIHIYGVDFDTLGQAGLSYAVADSGLIGVAHTSDYDYISCETHILNGMLIWPEITNYIVKGTIAESA